MRNLLKRLRTGMANPNHQSSAEPSAAPPAEATQPVARPSAPPDGPANPDYTADLALIERFSRDWDANAHAYRDTLGELRDAARRLLPLCPTVERVRIFEPEIACLARQPLYFPEMFHAARLLPDGSFEPLGYADQVLLRGSGLLGPGDRVAIREICQRVSQTSGAPLRIVEIGSAAGRGSTPIVGEFVKRSGGVLYCIDPWFESRYFGFLANLQVLDLETTVVPIRGISWEAAVLFDDGSLDAVFVDGSHFHPHVVKDIDAYLPKIKKGGILFGHDLNDLPSRFDRRELLELMTPEVNEIEVSHVNDKGETGRIRAHPGVILAVQDRFGDDVEILPDSVVWAKQI